MVKAAKRAGVELKRVSKTEIVITVEGEAQVYSFEEEFSFSSERS